MAAIVAAGAVAAGTGYALYGATRNGDVPCPDQADTQASTNAYTQVVGFTTLEELAGNADAIVVAEVDSCLNVHSHPESQELRLTDFKFGVEKSVKGDFSEGGTATVELMTSGSEAETHLMKAGERYVLFLTFNQITNSYFPVGGPQGRFQVIDEKVYSLDRIYPEMGFINVRANGEPLGGFISKVQALSG